MARNQAPFPAPADDPCCTPVRPHVMLNGRADGLAPGVTHYITGRARNLVNDPHDAPPTPDDANEALVTYLKRELPAIEVQAESGFSDSTLALKARFPRVFIGARLDDLVLVNEYALVDFGRDLVGKARRQAIEHYGLTPELEHARTSGRKLGRAEAVDNVRAALDKLRDPDLNNLPAEVSTGWLLDVLGSLPELEVPPTTDTRDLERAEGKARYESMRDGLGGGYGR